MGLFQKTGMVKTESMLKQKWGKDLFCILEKGIAQPEQEEHVEPALEIEAQLLW